MENVKQTKSIKEIELMIAKAIKKLGAKKENELCKYLPMASGGYMHHFTFKKKKHKEPEELAHLIERYIINSDIPSSVTPKQRAARGSRKKKDQITFTRSQMERMLTIARLAGDKEIITVLSPKRTLAGYKRELIQAIKMNRVEHELWNAYAEAVSSFNALEKEESASSI